MYGMLMMESCSPQRAQYVHNHRPNFSGCGYLAIFMNERRQAVIGSLQAIHTS